MSWLTLTLDVRLSEISICEDILLHAGALAITMLAADDEEIFEPQPGEMKLWHANRLRALLAPDAPLADLLPKLRRALPPDALSTLAVDFLDDEDWLNRWRAHAVQACFAGRLWVLPKDADEPQEGVVLRLDPGLAFGTGGHPTTHMCLTWLAEQPSLGQCVLDYGCGSGILALAALKLGAEKAVAIDHDEQALVATRDNAAYNGINPSQLLTSLPESFVMPNPADILVANILANPLIKLANTLQSDDYVHTQGWVVLSGLLSTQVDEVRAAYDRVDFDPTVFMGDWAMLTGVKSR